MSVLSRVFRTRRYVTPQPTDEQVAAVDVSRMLDQARTRGDRRSDDEIAAALLVGADLTAERHPDPEARLPLQLDDGLQSENQQVTVRLGLN